MNPQTLIDANNLNYQITKFKEQLTTLEKFEPVATIRIYNQDNVSTDLHTKHDDFIKDRCEDFVDGLKRDIEKKIKSLEKEFAKL